MTRCRCTAWGPCPICRQPGADVDADQGMDPVTRGWLWAIALAGLVCLLALVLATGLAMGTLTG